jgi:hypothetical protein
MFKCLSIVILAMILWLVLSKVEKETNLFIFISDFFFLKLSDSGFMIEFGMN